MVHDDGEKNSSKLVQLQWQNIQEFRRTTIGTKELQQWKMKREK